MGTGTNVTRLVNDVDDLLNSTLGAMFGGLLAGEAVSAGCSQDEECDTAAAWVWRISEKDGKE